MSGQTRLEKNNLNKFSPFPPLTLQIILLPTDFRKGVFWNYSNVQNLAFVKVADFGC